MNVSEKNSYFELYNEQLRDLLVPSLSSSVQPLLKIQFDQRQGMTVIAGLTERVVTSAEEVERLLREGES